MPNPQRRTVTRAPRRKKTVVEMTNKEKLLHAIHVDYDQLFEAINDGDEEQAEWWAICLQTDGRLLAAYLRAAQREAK